MALLSVATSGTIHPLSLFLASGVAILVTQNVYLDESLSVFGKTLPAVTVALIPTVSKRVRLRSVIQFSILASPRLARKNIIFESIGLPASPPHR
jgi:hypothetical protein